MTLTERITRARRLEAQYRAEAVGLSLASLIDAHSEPVYSSEPDEQEAFLRGLHDGRQILLVGQ